MACVLELLAKGLTVLHWFHSRRVGVSCGVCYVCHLHLSHNIRFAGSAAEHATKSKHAKCKCIGTDALFFVPVAVETAGTWGEEAKAFVEYWVVGLGIGAVINALDLT